MYKDFLLYYILKKSRNVSDEKLNTLFNKLDKIMKSQNDYEGNSATSKIKTNLFKSMSDKYPNTKQIIEIGMNGGHSATMFLHYFKKSNVLSFDICEHTYTEKCHNLINNEFNKRHTLIKGNSTKTVPKYNFKADIIYIDGGHYGKIPLTDLQNSLQYLSKPGTIILMDDTNYPWPYNLKDVDKPWRWFTKNNKIKSIKEICGISVGIVQ